MPIKDELSEEAELLITAIEKLSEGAELLITAI